MSLRRLRWWVQLALTGCLIVLPITYQVGRIWAHPDTAAFDLINAYVPAAEHVRSGSSPYVDPSDVASFGPESIHGHPLYVYPPLLATTVVPLTPLDSGSLAVVGTLVGILLAVATIAVAGVRDPRCYGALFLWAPVFNAIQNANASLVVALGLAVAWRLRARLWPAAVTLGLVIALKLFLLPLLVWPLALRRWRIGGAAAGAAATLILLPWATVRFAGLTAFPETLRRLGAELGPDSFSAAGVFSELGLGSQVGRAFGLALGALMVALAIKAGRSRDELRTLTYALAAALVASPIIWQHYLVLLLVPLALARPRLSWVWFVPTLGFLAASTGNGTVPRTLIVPLVAGVLLSAVLVLAPRPVGEQRRPSRSQGAVPTTAIAVERSEERHARS